MENLYEAPQSEIAPSHSTGEERPFYVVSQKKYWLLMILTAGLYTVYWNYKQWATYRTFSNEGMWPVARAIFSIFFIHKLYSLFELKARGKQGAPQLSSLGGIATLYVIFMIADNVLSRLSTKGIGSPVTDVLSLFMIPVIGILLWKGQAVANIACGDASGESNSKLTGANWVWLIIGGLFWLLILIGMADVFGLLPVE